ncbi:MAG: hypothetical protein ACR2F6_05145 [Mycobacteriales bacterium]
MTEPHHDAACDAEVATTDTATTNTATTNTISTNTATTNTISTNTMSTDTADDDGAADSLTFSTGIKWIDTMIAGLRGRSATILRVLRIVGYPAGVALVAYVAYRASKGVSFDNLRAWPIALSVILFGTYWMMLGKGWEVIAGEPVSRQGMAIWCKTQVLRYVPGSLLAPAARATSVQGRKRDKLAAVIGEQVTSLCAGTTMAGVLLTISGSLIFVPLLLAAAAPFVLHHFVRGRTSLSNRRMAHAGIWYLAAFLVYAAANIFAQIGVGHASDYARIGGAACLAWALGVIIIFAPGGLGAREAFYVKLIGNRLGVGLPSAGAVAARLASIVAELIVLVAFVGPHHLFQRRRAQAASDEAALAPPTAPSKTAARHQ